MRLNGTGNLGRGIMEHSHTPAFGGGGIDRAAELRGDPGKLEELKARPDARTLALWRRKPLMTGDSGESAALVRFGHPILGDSVEEPIFLGLADGAPRFATDVSAWENPEADPGSLNSFTDRSEQRHPSTLGDPELGQARFVELRNWLHLLSPVDGEMLAAAKGLFHWHSAHGFCSRCGHPTRMAMAGWQRKCGSCGALHFPRTDPVVIMLVTHGDSLLLGRSPEWPEKMYSCLAGFMEPGESIEAAVRRETLEETGISVGRVSYVSSQPWPFPNSLMIGCHGVALDSEITMDRNEIEDALWVSRKDMMDVFFGLHKSVRAPRKGAIANFLIGEWLKGAI